MRTTMKALTPGDVPENEGDFSDGEAGGDPLFEEAKGFGYRNPRKLVLR